jgi:hypothetical protein
MKYIINLIYYSKYQKCMHFRITEIAEKNYQRMAPISVAARSKALAYGRSLFGIAGSNPSRG